MSDVTELYLGHNGQATEDISKMMMRSKQCLEMFCSGLMGRKKRQEDLSDAVIIIEFKAMIARVVEKQTEAKLGHSVDF